MYKLLSTITAAVTPTHVLSELDINTLDAAISSDCHHCEMYQFEVAQELNLKASKSMIRTVAYRRKIH